MDHGLGVRMRSPVGVPGAAWLTLGMLLVVGCTSGQPGRYPGAPAFGRPVAWDAWGQGQTAAPANPAVAAATSASQSVATAFKQAGAKVSQALEVKPKVVPADDPAALASQPAQLSPATYVRAALWSETQGANATARLQYEKALALDPGNAKTLVAYARFQDRQGRVAEATGLYERARAAAPRNATVLNDLGLFQARQAAWEPAVQALREAVRLEPGNVRYCNNLAAVLVQTRRVDEAIAVLRAVHAEPVAQYNVGYLLYLQQDFDRAAWHFRQALQLDPAYAAAQEMLARLERGTPAGLPELNPPSRGLDEPDFPVHEPPPAERTATRTFNQPWSPASRPAADAIWPSAPAARPPRKLPPVE